MGFIDILLTATLASLIAYGLGRGRAHIEEENGSHQKELRILPAVLVYFIGVLVAHCVVALLNRYHIVFKRAENLDGPKYWFCGVVTLGCTISFSIWLVNILAYESYSILAPLVFAVSYWLTWVRTVKVALCGCEVEK